MEKVNVIPRIDFRRRSKEKFFRRWKILAAIQKTNVIAMRLFNLHSQSFYVTFCLPIKKFFL